MAADVVERWLESHSPACLANMRLRPLEHPGMPGTPLSVQRGQAEAYVLEADDCSRWILKRFHHNCNLDRQYLKAVAQLLPRHDGLIAGTERKVLAASDLARETNTYHSASLAQWLDGCLLMPRIQGVDWAALADELREGDIALGLDERVALCRSLCEIIELLEQHDLAHRDLSSGNVFFNTTTWSAALIDFDSLYAPQLPMPEATTCGTAGYAAPYAWCHGQLDASGTWRAHADRHALALLCAELLLMDKGLPLTAEGGMFDQNELRAHHGQGIQRAIDQLQAVLPQAAALFEQAIRASSFDECPSPQQWMACWSNAPISRLTPPSLNDMEAMEADCFANILRQQRPAAPLWPAPALGSLPQVQLTAPPSEPVVPAYAVSMPDNPWEIMP